MLVLLPCVAAQAYHDRGRARKSRSWEEDEELIEYTCSAPTQLISLAPLEFHPHDLQPLRRNTTYRALRVRIRDTSHAGALHRA